MVGGPEAKKAPQSRGAGQTQKGISGHSELERGHPEACTDGKLTPRG